MKSVKMMGFEDIFHFAEKEFGMHWNTANDVFFGTEVFRYNSVTNIYPGDQASYIRSFVPKKGFKASDVSKNDFDEMSDYDKARIIIMAYCEKNKIKHEFMVNAA